MVFGIEEAKDETGKNAGAIAQLRGLPGFNVDETQRRLEAIIRDGLDPRFFSLRFRTSTAEAMDRSSWSGWAAAS